MVRKLALTALTSGLMLAFGASTASAGSYDYLLASGKRCPNQTNTNASVRTQERAMSCMHNYVRNRTRRPRLKTQSLLMRSSNYKPLDIVRCGFSHTACGRDTFYWTKRVGYASGCWGAGENIAWGSGRLGSVRSIMRAWLNSTGHRQNILNSSFREKGVGLRKARFLGYSGAQVWTAQFGYRC